MGVGRDKEARDFQHGVMGFHVGIGGHGGPLGTTSGYSCEYFLQPIYIYIYSFIMFLNWEKLFLPQNLLLHGF